MRRQPPLTQPDAKETLHERASTWYVDFLEGVKKIAPAMIRAETDKMRREFDAAAAARPGAISDRFLDELKETMAEGIARAQNSVACGRVFRELFAGMDPLLRSYCLNLQEISVAWLVGFSDDAATRERFETETRKSQAEQLTARMATIAKRPRPKARGKSKWAAKVHRAAQAFYKQHMEAYRKDPARFWRWKEFAPECIAHIKEKTALTVTEPQLRRSLLPAEKFPRPE